MPLSDMSTARGTYFASQLPVMAILTSEAEYATRYAFPAGRFFSTLLEKDRRSPAKTPLPIRTRPSTKAEPTLNP